MEHSFKFNVTDYNSRSQISLPRNFFQKENPSRVSQNQYKNIIAVLNALTRKLTTFMCEVYTQDFTADIKPFINSIKKGQIAKAAKEMDIDTSEVENLIAEQEKKDNE